MLSLCYLVLNIVILFDTAFFIFKLANNPKTSKDRFDSLWFLLNNFHLRLVMFCHLYNRKAVTLFNSLCDKWFRIVDCSCCIHWQTVWEMQQMWLKLNVYSSLTAWNPTTLIRIKLCVLSYSSLIDKIHTTSWTSNLPRQLVSFRMH